MNPAGFWNKLNKPIFCLAPMADVTDCAFRQVITKYGKPPVLWTEFVSADGLAHPKAREKLLIDFRFSENEHPIVAQIFGSDKDNIREAAKLIRELGFDGVDINMGCPDRTIERQGAGACMIKNPELAREIIGAAREGAGDMPVSVKTRIGYNKIELEWIREILKERLPVLTVHLRTRKEMSKVSAHWDLMSEIVKLRDEISPETLIIGNGDVKNIQEAKEKCEQYGCDGVMLGRAIFGNPWLFSTTQKPSLEKHENFLQKLFSVRRRRSYQDFSQEASVSLRKRLEVMVEHTKLFEKLLGEHKNFAIMKKHYKAYVEGFPGAKELRMELMDAKDVNEVEAIVDRFLAKE